MMYQCVRCECVLIFECVFKCILSKWNCIAERRKTKTQHIFVKIVAVEGKKVEGTRFYSLVSFLSQNELLLQFENLCVYSIQHIDRRWKMQCNVMCVVCARFSL